MSDNSDGGNTLTARSLKRSLSVSKKQKENLIQ
jgi:hypothetical protein